LAMDIDEAFLRPSSEYRGKPFWAWNGLLREDELRRQIRVFKRMGLGGAFMHSRVGLATRYLSEEWFDLVESCVDECSKQGMEAWLYDEDRWPSGAAGGIVTKDPMHRQMVLRLSILDTQEYRPDRTELGVFVARVEGSSAYNVRRIDSGVARATGGERVLVFKAQAADPSFWYNGQTYLDTMSPSAVDRFIEVTHEAYARRVGKAFGNVVPGIFTDEPNYGGYDVEQTGAHAPWTRSLPSVFTERYGYDILAHLPEIFYRVEGQEFSKVRYHYRDCLTHLFTRSFAEKIGRWCEENGLLFTGHVLGEENLLSQTSVVGSAMRFYEFMQAPGIDILRGQILTRQGGVAPEFATAKQCSSVQHQFGRRWMLSELYGCTGWQFTFAEHKAVGDWQAALGVNLRCPHLSYYTMLGPAKRDYPASISFQSPWWRDYGYVEDYFARVGVMMSEGEVVRDIAVIHPIESAWALFCGRFRDCAALWELNSRFEAVQDILLREHFDFDYVDEDILSRHGRPVADGLAVAKAVYRAVVVPPTLTLRSSTLAILERLIGAGVPVLFISPVAKHVDAEPSDEAERLALRARMVSLDRGKITKALVDLGRIRRVSIKTKDGKEYPNSLYMLRFDQKTGRYLAFICHTIQDKGSGPLLVTMPGEGQVQEWDPVSGRIFAAEADRRKGFVRIHTDMAGCGSRIFVVDPKPCALRRGEKLREVARRPIRLRRWPILRDEPNAIPLDVGYYSLQGGSWKGPLEVLRMDRAVRDAIGLPHRGGGMVQPWAREPRPEGEGVELSVRFPFKVQCIPSGPCHLVMEKPEDYRITLNGRDLTADQDEGWWIDNSFKRIRVPPSFLRYGENELVLSTCYGPDHGLEAVYLTGEFGATRESGRPVITSLPTSLRLGDWTEQGFPHYSGSITYVADIDMPARKEERLFLELPGWEGVLSKVRVNGKDAGLIAWPPWEVEITGCIAPGKNRLEIEIVASRRNILGPLHLAEVYPPWTGPAQFETSGDKWTDDYVKIPYGLTKFPVLSIRRLR